jgi:hypothetical protein
VQPHAAILAMQRLWILSIFTPYITTMDAARDAIELEQGAGMGWFCGSRRLDLKQALLKAYLP